MKSVSTIGLAIAASAAITAITLGQALAMGEAGSGRYEVYLQKTSTQQAQSPTRTVPQVKQLTRADMPHLAPRDGRQPLTLQHSRGR